MDWVLVLVISVIGICFCTVFISILIEKLKHQQERIDNLSKRVRLLEKHYFGEIS